MAWLEVQHLSHYQQGDPLLNNISLTLEPTQRLGIMSAIGAGTSQLLAMLAKQQAAHEGTVRHAWGLRVGYLPKFSAADFPQSASTLWDYAQSALKRVQKLEQALRQQEKKLHDASQLEHYRQLQEDFDALGGYQAEERLKKYLKHCKLEERRWQTALGQLARAEQQQLRIAMLLTQQPEVLLLDEPFAPLPLREKVALERLLQRYLKQQPSALIMASHDRASLHYLCKQRYWLRAGKLQLEKFASPAPKHSPVQNEVVLEHPKPSFQLKKGQKIAFFAKNSEAKELFLKTLLKSKLRLCYWDENFSSLAASPWQTLSPYISGVEIDILLQRVGLQKQQHSEVTKLSRSQQARLMLAWLQVQTAELIILEHASQHLDLPMRSLLADYLQRSSASIVLCDDERQFLQICHNFWQLEADKVISYANLDSFLAQKDGKILTPSPKVTLSLSPLEQEARLEKKLLAIEDALALPLLEREGERLQNDRQKIQDDLFFLYNQRIAQQYPALRSEYYSKIAGMAVHADKNEDGSYDFSWQNIVLGRVIN